MSIELSDYTLAGIFVTQSIPRPDFSDSELLPDRLISLSSCLCGFFPAPWAISWTSETDEARIKYASVFGMVQSKLKTSINAVTELFEVDFGWESVIYSRVAAERLVEQFLPENTKAQIIGAALHNFHVEDYLNCASPSEPEPGQAPVGVHGTCQVLSKRNSPEVPRVILGFEPLVCNDIISCSWLCNGLERECHSKLGVSPNSYGLIDNFYDAKRCTEHIALDEVGSEPGLWLPWLLLRYA